MAEDVTPSHAAGRSDGSRQEVASQAPPLVSVQKERPSTRQVGVAGAQVATLSQTMISVLETKVTRNKD